MGMARGESGNGSSMWFGFSAEICLGIGASEVMEIGPVCFRGLFVAGLSEMDNLAAFMGGCAGFGVKTVSDFLRLLCWF